MMPTKRLGMQGTQALRCRAKDNECNGGGVPRGLQIFELDWNLPNKGITSRSTEFWSKYLETRGLPSVVKLAVMCMCVNEIFHFLFWLQFCQLLLYKICSSLKNHNGANLTLNPEFSCPPSYLALVVNFQMLNVYLYITCLLINDKFLKKATEHATAFLSIT